MSWPLSQDYNEAIQSAASNFTDPDLKRGEATANALGLPMPYSGNFADVYQVRCPDGKSWAVKCFTRQAVGLRERYLEISAHLKQAKLPFSVDFSYLEKGIRVAGVWYPVLKMQWVEGLTLNQFVGQNLEKPAMLEALLQLWARMGKYLRAAEIGHCDLQHGNVLLVPGATANSLALKLIDYDGMWVPALAGNKSGEVGHANYQHPRRLREGTYSLEVDRFPLLLVATAMRALKADKGLWAKYDNGDNMLFKESDLAAPSQSELFQELASLPDPGLVMLAAQVRAALKGNLESAALLEDAMPDAKGAPAPARAPKSAGASSTSIPRAAPVVAAPVAAAPPSEQKTFAFDEDAPPLAASAASARIKRNVAKDKSGGVPMKVWIGAAAAAVVVIGLVGGLAAWAMSGSSNQPKQATAPPTAPPSPSPPPPSEAVVSLQIDQAGAEVAVDGQRITVDVPGNGKPARIPMKPGEYKLSVTKEGYKPFTKDLTLSAGQALSLPVQLESIDKPPPVSIADRFPILPGRTGNIRVEGDALVLDDLDHIPACANIYFGDTKWADYDFQADVRRLAGSSHCVLWFRLEGLGNAWGYSLGKGSHLVTLENQVDARWRDHLDQDIGPIGNDNWYTLLVSVRGAKIQCFLDKRLMFATTSLDHPRGCVGLHTNSTQFAFRNIKVTAPDGKVLLAGLPDLSPPMPPVVQAPDHPQLREAFTCLGPQANGPVHTLCVSRDGKVGMALGNDRVIRRFNLEKDAEVVSLDRSAERPRAVAFLPDGKRILYGGDDKLLHLWDLEKGAQIKQFSGHTKSVAWLDVAPDGKRAMSGGDDGMIWLWDLEKGGEVRHWPARAQAVSFVRYSPDGKAVLSFGLDDTVRLWDAAKGAQTYAASALQDENAKPFTAAFSPDGEHGVIGFNRGMWIFGGLQTGAQVRKMSLGIDVAIRCAAVSPDGRLVVLADGGGMGDLQRGFYLWDSKDPSRFPNPKTVGPILAPDCVAFLPNGRRILVGCIDGSVHLWEIQGVPLDPAFKPAGPTVDVKPEKLRPPDAADLARAVEAVKSDFKTDYDNLKTPKDRAGLSAKLAAGAEAAKDGPARRYALLLEARDLAAQGEDLAGAIRIAETMAADFDVNGREAKAAALQAAGATFGSKGAAKAYLDAALPLLEEARAADDYESVESLLPALRQASKDAQEPEAGKIAAQMEHLQQAYQAVKPSLDSLKDKPDDPDANLVVGKFFCLDKQVWDKGLPLLAKGSGAFAEAAKLDADAPTKPGDQAAVGDAWSKLADNSSVLLRPALQRRAYDWYNKALPNLTAKDEERVRGRLIELTKLFPDFATAWVELDVSKVEVVGDCYLRLKVGQILSTKQPVDGPVEITAVIRGPKGPTTFHFLQAKEAMVDWEFKTNGLTMRRPPAPAKLRTSAVTYMVPFTFNADVWAAYSCKVTEEATDMYAEGKLQAHDELKNDLSKPRTFQLLASDQPLEIQLFTVKPVKP